ncbi:MAG: HU family DNA-binding protein [Pseudomonadales bacterium]|nr:HU family DNA-binding protein [Pseudomonadales bacterium]
MAAKKKAVKKAIKKAVKKAVAPVRKIVAIKDPMSKTAMLTEIAENTELSKKQVQAVFDELGIIIERHVAKRGAGMFTLPGLLKVTVVRKPATKARKGINPFTGEETVFKAKPARNVVKIRPLKKLKDMVV